MPLAANVKAYVEHSYIVVPNDGVDLPGGAIWLYVGGTGAISYDPADGSTTAVILTAVPVGTQLNIAMKRIRATGTTATLMVAGY